MISAFTLKTGLICAPRIILTSSKAIISTGQPIANIIALSILYNGNIVYCLAIFSGTIFRREGSIFVSVTLRVGMLKTFEEILIRP